MVYFENYGIIPPENSKPIWGKDNSNEDDIITSLDFKLSLQKLSDTEQEIIKLCNDGYSVREIASLIDLPRATVQDIKDRAIKKLKEMMDGEDSIHSIFT